MKLVLFLFILILLTPKSSFATYMGLGIFTPNINAQDDQGDKDRLQFNPTVILGHNFTPLSWWWNHRFSPVIGFTLHSKTDDDYGDHTKKTIFLLYDFAFPLNPGIVFRYGIGNFITRISGDGGTVTVPNGASTTTAYQPSEVRNSYNSALNFGLELYSPTGGLTWFNTIGLRGEGHVFQFLSKDKRTFGYTLFVIGYF